MKHALLGTSAILAFCLIGPVASLVDAQEAEAIIVTVRPGEGLYGALKDAGCDPDQLSSLMKQERIDTSMLRSIPANTEYKVNAENCKQAPSVATTLATKAILRADTAIGNKNNLNQKFNEKLAAVARENAQLKTRTEADRVTISHLNEQLQAVMLSNPRAGTGQSVVLGAGYASYALPICVVLLLVMGIVLLLMWKSYKNVRGDAETAQRNHETNMRHALENNDKVKRFYDDAELELKTTKKELDSSNARLQSMEKLAEVTVSLEKTIIVDGHKLSLRGLELRDDGQYTGLYLCELCPEDRTSAYLKIQQGTEGDPTTVEKIKKHFQKHAVPGTPPSSGNSLPTALSAA